MPTAAKLHRLAGRILQPYARVDYIPQSGTKNLAIGFITNFKFVKSENATWKGLPSAREKTFRHFIHDILPFLYSERVMVAFLDPDSESGSGEASSDPKEFRIRIQFCFFLRRK